MADPRPVGAGRAVLVTGVVAVALAAAWLAAPPMGTDLSAQVARADFAAAHGLAPIDFRWYGGIYPHGYSLVSPPVMGWLGPRPAGAVAAVVSALALVVILLRTGARRPLAAGVVGAACILGNLVSGRVTFALGVAFGLLAILALTLCGETRPRWWRWAGAGALASVATATSPVAGLFLGLAGVAMLLAHNFGGVVAVRRPDNHDSAKVVRARRRGIPRSWTAGAPIGASGVQDRGVSGSRTVARLVPGLALVGGAAVAMAVMVALFPSGGTMNMSREDMMRAAGAGLAVAVLVPHRVLRVGALLSVGGVVAAYLIPTPVGLNSVRLAAMFALPVLVGYAARPGWWPAAVGLLRRVASGGSTAVRKLAGWPRGWLAGRVAPRYRTAVWLVPAVAAVAVWQPPVHLHDLAGAGDPTTAREYFAPLAAELARRAPAGRVEVVPTRDYWESAHLGGVPLARGWLRQADRDRHPLFFNGSLDAGSYRDWLLHNGVSYVALADAPLSWVGSGEAALIRDGLPYLTEVWAGDRWTLYRVAGEPALVDGPGALRSAAPDGMVVAAAAAGDLLLRVRWYRWLAVSGPAGACLAPAGDWTAVRVTAPGTYRVTGSLTAPGPHC